MSGNRIWIFFTIFMDFKHNIMVGKTGFEPATSWTPSKRSTKLSYFPGIKDYNKFNLKMPTFFTSIMQYSGNAKGYQSNGKR